MLQGKKILLGITGSIAAYKSITLVRLLVKAGAEVKVVMTKAATDFASPLVLATLSKNEAIHDLSNGDTWANHVELGRWANVMLIAPLSCNTLAKMANGLCDNLLTAVYLSATCPVIVAPAMDEEMWIHPSTKKNIETIISFANKVVPVGHGELASGLIGPGRMAEPEEMVLFLEDFFQQKNTLTGKKILVTAGPTYEPIDPVRFIGNHSSGKMGIALANQLHELGANVVLVLGPSQFVANDGVETIRVKTAMEMYEACMAKFPEMDAAIMSAAVADYRPKEMALQKIKKEVDDGLTVELVKNPDILKSCGLIKKNHQLLIGFALETNNEANYAKQKLVKKNADAIVMNSLKDEGAGFGKDTNKITIFEKDGKAHEYDLMSKKEVAKNVVNWLVSKFQQNNWV